MQAASPVLLANGSPVVPAGGGALLAANSFSEIAALGVASQRTALQNLTLADVNGALTFAAWGANQNITFTPSGTGALVVGIPGTPANPSLRFAQGGSPGIYSDAASVIRLSIGGTRYYSFTTAGLQYLGGAGASAFTVDAAGGTGIGGPAAATLAFTTGGVERGRFASTGNLLLGGLTTDGTGVLQLPTATTSAGGIAFGTDTALFRSSAGILTMGTGSPVLQARYFGGSNVTTGYIDFGASANANASYIINGTGSHIFNIGAGGGTTAFIIKSSFNSLFAGALAVKSYTVAGLPTGIDAYSMAYVTDATLTAITGLGLAPTGGGANKVRVNTTDGTNWVIG